jgi:DNA-directed RNA polymerase subunit RPC12/RpoP
MKELFEKLGITPGPWEIRTRTDNSHEKFIVTCSKCSKKINANDEKYFGKNWIQCPRCGQDIRLYWIHTPIREPGCGKEHMSKKDRRRERALRKKMFSNLVKPRNFQFKKREEYGN